MVLSNIKMNLPQVYMCSPSWTLLPPPSPYHPSGSSQCTSPKHPVSCIEPGLRKAFLSLLTILWNSAFKWVYLSFSPLPLASLCFSAICKASSENHYTFLDFFFLGMILITASYTMSWKKESEVSQLCPTLCHPFDCGLSDFSVRGIFQVRVLEWVAITFSRGPSQSRDRTLLNCRQMLFPCEPSGKSWISAHSSTGTLSDLIPWIYLSFPLHNHKRFGLGIPEWSSGYSYFLQFKAEFCNKEFMIGATVSSWSCFCWLYRASPPLAAKNVINWFWYWPSGDVHV